ncbi:MAG: hypothetical protein IPH22_01690 [Nitrosomonas sp.]|nr:hypothetical protein [Nitrosomonas sp.]
MAHADWSFVVLGSFGGGGFSGASDINDSGQVVGWYEVVGPIPYSHAFITGPNGIGMTDLGTLT